MKFIVHPKQFPVPRLDILEPLITSFWNNWFFQKGIPDLAISNIEHQGQNYIVTISNNGTEMIPVHLSVNYNDGTSGRFTVTIAVWQRTLKQRQSSLRLRSRFRK